MRDDQPRWPAGTPTGPGGKGPGGGRFRDAGPPAGHFRLYHGRIRLPDGAHLQDPRVVAAMVEHEYGLPEGSIAGHREFSDQRWRAHDNDGDDFYYMGLLEDAQSYAAYGGEMLGDALRSAYHLTHGLPEDERTIDDRHNKDALAWVRSQVPRFGAAEIESVDVPHEVWLEDWLADLPERYREGERAAFPPFGDDAAWQALAERRTYPAGVGIRRSLVHRLIIQPYVGEDWADAVSDRLPSP